MVTKFRNFKISYDFESNAVLDPKTAQMKNLI